MLNEPKFVPFDKVSEELALDPNFFGGYTVMCATYEPRIHGSFHLHIQLDADFEVDRIEETIQASSVEHLREQAKAKTVLKPMRRQARQAPVEKKKAQEMKSKVEEQRKEVESIAKVAAKKIEPRRREHDSLDRLVPKSSTLKKLEARRKDKDPLDRLLTKQISTKKMSTHEVKSKKKTTKQLN